MIALAFVIGLLALSYVAFSCPVKGLGRWLAPDTLSMLMLFMIFGIRPLFRNRFQVRSIYGLTPSAAGSRTALIAGILGMAAFAGAAFVFRLRPRSRALLQNKSPQVPRRRVRVTAVGALTIAIGGTVTYVLLVLLLAGPSVLRSLSGGRSVAANLGSMPEIGLLVPIAGSVAAAIFILSRRGLRISRTEVYLVIAAIAVSVIVLAQLGNRRFLIPSILIPAIAALIRKPVRLRLLHCAGVFAALVILAIIPMVRSAGARSPGDNLVTASWRYLQAEGIEGALTPIFSSYDTEMLDYVAIGSDEIRDGAGPGFGKGRGTLLEFVTRPLPSSMNPGRPYSDQMLTSLYGGGCGKPVCPVASVVGVLYFDGSQPFVLAGCFLVGAFVRWLSIRWTYNAQLGLLGTTSVAVASSFAFVGVRTDTVHAMWWCIYSLMIAALVYRLCSTPQDADPHRRRPPAAGLAAERRQLAAHR